MTDPIDAAIADPRKSHAMLNKQLLAREVERLREEINNSRTVSESELQNEIKQLRRQIGIAREALESVVENCQTIHVPLCISLREEAVFSSEVAREIAKTAICQLEEDSK